MAKDKSSFILYADLLATVSKLTDKRAGMLFKTILEYVNDLNPEVTDPLIDIAFEPIKQQLKRDLKKWDKYIEKQSENGKLGGRPKKPKETQTTQPFFEKPKKADSGNGTVNVNVTVNDAEKEILSNQIQLEQICMNTKNTDLDFVKSSLRKFHLHLQENDRYPQKRSQVFAGFEKWLLKEKKQTHGHTAIESSTRHKGAGLLINSLKQDYASRRKEDD